MKHQNEKDQENHGQSYVVITINGDDYSIHRGSRTVAEIKTAGNVPITDKLEQVINGELVPLNDNASVVIKGGEEFKSHVPSGGAS